MSEIGVLLHVFAMCAHVQTNKHTHTVHERVQIVRSVYQLHNSVVLSTRFSTTQTAPAKPFNYFAQGYSPTRDTQTCEILYFLLHNMDAEYHLSADVCRQVRLLSYYCKETPNRWFEKMSFNKTGNVCVT